MCSGHLCSICAPDAGGESVYGKFRASMRFRNAKTVVALNTRRSVNTAHAGNTAHSGERENRCSTR
jgi:hypothetical protein